MRDISDNNGYWEEFNLLIPASLHPDSLCFRPPSPDRTFYWHQWQHWNYWNQYFRNQRQQWPSKSFWFQFSLLPALMLSFKSPWNSDTFHCWLSPNGANPAFEDKKKHLELFWSRMIPHYYFTAATVLFGDGEKSN